ncbi:MULTISPECIES: multicopper oxidase domain-containing protein [Nonomuraea]|uniref:Multicopper oxidase domain-containing protein n=2 Tax=Nonomuraea ferruginea TaxID=46174 RepID=A0ABT4SV36_9ACTN|nr:multicopper oxidase domain-containing protein [Nonomuraea ferruginea]MDA0641132.1 multicopper oxidase domain-containing protein [Nonomuraea ferruginea]TXK33991.1 hypothetical protein FR742_31745 [Nonomuraea sp. C10]
MRRGRTELLPGRPAETWGFNGPHLGPTIRAARGDEVRMTVTNRLAETSTVHWHGMRLPASRRRARRGWRCGSGRSRTRRRRTCTTATSCGTRTRG